MTHRDFEMTEEERALEKKIRRENIKEIIAAILVGVCAVVFIWLYLIVTPDQMSAECDNLKYQMQQAVEAKGK